MRRKDRQFGEVSEKTRKNMQKIRSKDTSIEVMLRNRLWHDTLVNSGKLKKYRLTKSTYTIMMMNGEWFCQQIVLIGHL